MKLRFWQMCWFPARHAGQVPSQSKGMTVTWSPAVHSVTPSPTAATTPLISWPMTAGVVTRASMLPWKMCRSVPQKPV